MRGRCLLVLWLAEAAVSARTPPSHTAWSIPWFATGTWTNDADNPVTCTSGYEPMLCDCQTSSSRDCKVKTAVSPKGLTCGDVYTLCSAAAFELGGYFEKIDFTRTHMPGGCTAFAHDGSSTVIFYSRDGHSQRFGSESRPPLCVAQGIITWKRGEGLPLTWKDRHGQCCTASWTDWHTASVSELSDDMSECTGATQLSSCPSLPMVHLLPRPPSTATPAPPLEKRLQLNPGYITAGEGDDALAATHITHPKPMPPMTAPGAASALLETLEEPNPIDPPVPTTPPPPTPVTWTPRAFSTKLGEEEYHREMRLLTESSLDPALKRFQGRLLREHKKGSLDIYTVKNSGWPWNNVNESLASSRRVKQLFIDSERDAEKMRLETLEKESDEKRKMQRGHLDAISSNFRTAFRSMRDARQLRREREEAGKERQAHRRRRAPPAYQWETLMMKDSLDARLRAEEDGAGALMGMFSPRAPSANTSRSSPTSHHHPTTAPEEWVRPHEVANQDDLERHLGQAKDLPGMVSRALTILHNFWYYQHSHSRPQFGCTGPTSWCESQKS